MKTILIQTPYHPHLSHILFTMADHAKIRKQIEFYFSDSNIAKDKFLKGKATETPEGWVSLEVIGSFKRMKELTEDAAVIAEALKTANPDIIEVSIHLRIACLNIYSAPSSWLPMTVLAINFIFLGPNSSVRIARVFAAPSRFLESTTTPPHLFARYGSWLPFFAALTSIDY